MIGWPPTSHMRHILVPATLRGVILPPPTPTRNQTVLPATAKIPFTVRGSTGLALQYWLAGRHTETLLPSPTDAASTMGAKSPGSYQLSNT